MHKGVELKHQHRSTQILFPYHTPLSVYRIWGSFTADGEKTWDTLNKGTMTEMTSKCLVNATYTHLKTKYMQSSSLLAFNVWWLLTQPLKLLWSLSQSTLHHLLRDWMSSTFTQSQLKPAVQLGNVWHFKI